jgi:hypothetical protein
MTTGYDEGYEPYLPPEDEPCEECGVPIGQHGDVCDPAALDVAAEEARAERVREAWEDRDDMIAGSW